MTSTDERLNRIEKRLDEFDALLEHLMLLAAQNPVGRQLLKAMAKGGR
jgi:hypothetical protein